METAAQRIRRTWQDSASLTPMYFVTEGGTLLALVDAQTGKVSKGMNER
jgi:hypothetical protein